MANYNSISLGNSHFTIVLIDIFIAYIKLLCLSVVFHKSGVSKKFAINKLHKITKINL